MITNQDIEKALEWLTGNGRNASKARAEREYMEEYKGVLKAQIMRENASEPLGAQEAIAKSDPRYLEHLKLWKEAVERDVYLNWMRSAADTKIEVWRSQQANERAMGKVT